ncbi:MAG: hypothetical protein JSV62_00255 [Promethearchaeota archaeon]|nr:MAG: hypothetical protein JSV62_00255 [Candidatus Lokiarchaeota archaeon]
MNDESVSQVNVAAYYLAQKGYTYDKLCWMLAERQLLVQQDPNYNQENRIREKAAEIFFSGPAYDVLCYLISEIDIMMKLGKTR